MQKLQTRNLSVWMRTALAVVKSGSPTHGAKQLGVSITTVYRHLDALERSLELRIFDRTNAGWTLREEACVLLTVGKEIERLLKNAENELRDRAGTGYGSLRIAVSDDFAVHYVVPGLAAFREACDGMRPDLVVSHEFADLVHGEADVAIRPDRDPGDSLVGLKVGRMTHAFYASREYVERHGRPTSPSGLNAHRLCGYGSALANYTAARWLDDNARTDAIVARFGNTTAMARAVVEGVGIGLLPCYVGDRLSSLTPVMTIDGALPVDIWLVTAAASRKRPKVRAFFKFFANKIRSDKTLFAGRPYTTRHR